MIIHPGDAEPIHYISGVYINRDDSDDFDSEVTIQWLSDSFNQFANSENDLVVVVFHGCFTTTLMLIKCSACFLSPHDAGGEKGNLSAVVL